MVFKVGHTQGGRPKGAKNKINRSVADQLADLDCNPFEALVRVGRRAEKTGALHVAKGCYTELAQYVCSKQRSSVEVSTLEDLVISWRTDPEEQRKIIHVDAIEDE
jgi:hypothetical protein